MLLSYPVISSHILYLVSASFKHFTLISIKVEIAAIKSLISNNWGMPELNSLHSYTHDSPDLIFLFKEDLPLIIN